jgi:hypothetical protein
MKVNRAFFMNAFKLVGRWTSSDQYVIQLFQEMWVLFYLTYQDIDRLIHEYMVPKSKVVDYNASDVYLDLSYEALSSFEF